MAEESLDRNEKHTRTELKNRLMIVLRDIPRQMVDGEETRDGNYLPDSIYRKPNRNLQVGAACEKLMDEESLTFPGEEKKHLSLAEAVERLEKWQPQLNNRRARKQEIKSELGEARRENPEYQEYIVWKDTLRALQKSAVNAVELKRREVEAEQGQATSRSR